MTHSIISTNFNDTAQAADQKLLGAAAFVKAYQIDDFDRLKARTITFNSPSILAAIHQRYPKLSNVDDSEIFSSDYQAQYETQYHDNLYTHLRYLQLEFIGQSELLFYHTLLIVLLRRGYQPEQTFTLFELLWQTHNGYFFEKLSLRWLVSAADTFIDFSESPLRRAILMNVVSVINTLKIYETQRFLLTDNQVPIPPKMNALYAKHQVLYDGLTFFRLGSDDTLEQMRRRFLKFEKVDAFATQFLLTVLYRLHDTPSAFSLIKQLHNEDWGYNW